MKRMQIKELFEEHSMFYWKALPVTVYALSYFFVARRIRDMHRRINPWLRSRLIVADVDQYYFRENWPAPERLNGYLQEYYTPRKGELVESCSSQIGYDMGRLSTPLGVVETVDIRHQTVYMFHGGSDDFRCVDPVGWREKYLNEDGSPI